MKKEKTRLKNLNVNSVDLVRRGANQEADIKLFKSADFPDIPANLPENEAQGLWDAIKKAVSDWLSGGDDIRKSQEIRKSYDDAIMESIESILKDDSMVTEAKVEMMGQSINEYFDACEVLNTSEVGKTAQEAQNPFVSDESINDNKSIGNIEKSQSETKPEGQNFSNYTEEGEEMKIDKSRFSPAELEQYEALIAKGLVEDDDIPPEEGEVDDDMEKGCKTKKKKTCKSADGEEEMHPEVKKALEEVAEMKKSYEMKELTEVAKKYSILGKKEDELAQTLYDMKKSSQSVYDSYIAVLDEQVDMVNKSGAFTEIGKSAHGGSMGGGTEAKIDSIATEIQKADPTLDRVQAIAKAWDQHPELVAEYERNYK